MIKIKNNQKKIPVDIEDYRQKAQIILNHLKYHDFDLGILLTTEKTIQKYNREFRNKDKATDVLSFPYHTDIKAGKKIKVLSDDDKNLGDIIIAVSYVFKNKHNLEGDFNNRMNRMLVHAICHLLGYDHQEDNDFKKMMTLEKKLLKLIS